MDGPGRPSGAPPARAPGRARTPALRNAGPGLLHLRLHEGREPLRSLRPRPVAQRGARPHQGLARPIHAGRSILAAAPSPLAASSRPGGAASEAWYAASLMAFDQDLALRLRELPSLPT